MNRYIALVVGVFSLACILALVLVLTVPIEAQSQQKAPCFPGTGWGCPVPVVKWRLTCVTPNSTEPILAPLDAQWVGIQGKLCYVVVAERPKL